MTRFVQLALNASWVLLILFGFLALNTGKPVHAVFWMVFALHPLILGVADWYEHDVLGDQNT